jgi:hypothetical protein
MWYLATSEERVPFHEFMDLVDGVGEAYSLTLTEGTDEEWVEISLSHREGDRPIGNLRCLPVRRGVPDDPGSAEIDLFLEQIEECEPTCNILWLRQFLPQVRTVYIWSLWSGTEVKDGWVPVRQIGDVYIDGEETAVYAELEGWSNADGNHITWEFTDDVKGGEPWWFGLYLDGRWHRFQMDLGDRERRECFRRGVVPPGV